MAKKVDIEDVDLMNPNEEDKDSIVEETVERVAKKVVVNTEVKKVKIRVTEDVNSIVACVPYTFAKDKEYLVPSDVAAILCHAGKAYRL